MLGYCSAKSSLASLCTLEVVFFSPQIFVVQHCEVTMVNAQFSRHVASLETREGCPITPGASFTKQFYLVPLASSNKDRRGIALDGHLKVISNDSETRTRTTGMTSFFCRRTMSTLPPLPWWLKENAPLKLWESSSRTPFA